MSEEVDQTIDKYALAFLDEFQEIFGYLPNDKEFSLWKSGFMDGCSAIKEVLQNRVQICIDCSDENCKVCHP
jgi:hypothetical protein